MSASVNGQMGVCEVCPGSQGPRNPPRLGRQDPEPQMIHRQLRVRRKVWACVPGGSCDVGNQGALSCTIGKSASKELHRKIRERSAFSPFTTTCSQDTKVDLAAHLN